MVEKKFGDVQALQRLVDWCSGCAEEDEKEKGEEK
jgi:hypothetical protein